MTPARWHTLTSAPVLAGALVVVTALAAGPLRGLDEELQDFYARRHTPNWWQFLDTVPNAIAGQAVCLPVLLAVALWLAWTHRTWHPIAVAAAAELAFYAGIGGMKVLLARSAPQVEHGARFWDGGFLEHGWYGMSYPSGHASEAVLIYGAAAYLVLTYADPDTRLRNRLGWIVAGIAVNAVLVSAWLGFHWPTDLVGGLLAGGLLLRLVITLDRAVAAHRLRLPDRPSVWLESPRGPLPALIREARAARDLRLTERDLLARDARRQARLARGLRLLDDPPRTVVANPPTHHPPHHDESPTLRVRPRETEARSQAGQPS